MPTTATNTAKKSTKTGTPDAIELLTSDHKAVKALFQTFEKLKDGDASVDEKSALVQRICAEITVHATIEEEIFYPAVREAIDDDDLMDEAEVEHDGVKELIAQLEAASPEDDHYDAKVTVLGELIDHHAKEEEEEMFVKAKKKIDVVAIGAELAERKAELFEEIEGIEPADPPQVTKKDASTRNAKRTS